MQYCKRDGKINKIDFQVESYYDEWTITNFESEYKKKIEKIDAKDKLLVSKVYEQMSKVDFQNLKCPIHMQISLNQI